MVVVNADPEVQKRSKEALLVGENRERRMRDRKTQKLKIKERKQKRPKKGTKEAPNPW